MIDLLSSIEHSISLLLLGAGVDAITFSGQSERDQVRPCVVIYAQSGEESPLGSGNQFCPVTITIKSSADIDNAEQVHKERVSSILQTLQIDDLSDRLSAQQDDFTVFGYRGMSLRNAIEENSFTSEIQLELYCCQMSLA